MKELGITCLLHHPASPLLDGDVGAEGVGMRVCSIAIYLSQDKRNVDNANNNNYFNETAY